MYCHTEQQAWKELVLWSRKMVCVEPAMFSIAVGLPRAFRTVSTKPCAPFLRMSPDLQPFSTTWELSTTNERYVTLGSNRATWQCYFCGVVQVSYDSNNLLVQSSGSHGRYVGSCVGLGTEWQKRKHQQGQKRRKSLHLTRSGDLNNFARSGRRSSEAKKSLGQLKNLQTFPFLHRFSNLITRRCP